MCFFYKLIVFENTLINIHLNSYFKIKITNIVNNPIILTYYIFKIIPIFRLKRLFSYYKTICFLILLVHPSNSIFYTLVS